MHRRLAPEDALFIVMAETGTAGVTTAPRGPQGAPLACRTSPLSWRERVRVRGKPLIDHYGQHAEI